MWHETLQEAMDVEKSAYIASHVYSENTDEPGAFFGSAPRQFNVQVGEYEDGTKVYKVEFLEEEGTWRDATTWASGADATKIFIDCDAGEIDLLDFDKAWITKL